VSGITPSQTVGPYFAYGLTSNGKYDWNDAFTNNLVTSDATGERIRVEGRVFDGDGQPVPDCMLEIWQADAQGRFADPKDKRAVFVFDVFADLLDLRVITTGIKILLGFIGLLTLGIGGVGLMNIMLVSVTQRTREIGVEKALGARGWHILVQFLAEALAITLLGGIAGVVLAYLVSWSVGSLTLWSAFIENGSEGDIHLTIDSTTLLASTMILGFVGVISGMLPAIKASRLDPIEALRYE